MRLRSTPIGLALLLGATLAAAKPSATVQKLYVEGVKLLAKGELEGAVERFEQALTIERTAPLLFNLGQAKLKLGHLVEAKRAFQEAATVAQKKGPKAIVDLASSSLAELKDRVPSIVVDRPSGTKVRVDDKEVDAKGPIDVDPGRHEVVVEKSGYVPYRVTLDLREGDRERVQPKMRKMGVSEPGEPDEPNEASSEGGGGSIVGPIVLAGVGLAAIGGGVYFYTKMKSLDDQRTALWKDSGCPGPSCPNGEPDDARALREDAQAKARTGNVLVGVGAAALVGSAVWYYFASKSSKEGSARVVVSPALGGAVVSGQF